ncbi:MAG: acetoacetyl-CoA synthetase [Actinomycetota bacterium]|nr:acetoacetyl-CoA synthetase [Actinomycetota bacterium]
MTNAVETLWNPPPDVRDRTGTGLYLRWLEERRGLTFEGYHELWQWSVDHLEDFWQSIWDYFEVRSETPYERVLTSHDMPGARWFPGATLNYAEHVLRGARQAGADGGPVILARSQTRPPSEFTAMELEDQVARARVGLARVGVGKGDRVAAYLPNVPETQVAFLAAASLGAIWASCAPEFGTHSVVDRLRQIEPKVLFAVDGYRFGEKAIDRTADVNGIRSELPSLETVVAVPYLYPGEQRLEYALAWSDFMSEAGRLAFDPVPFDHPLYVLYSSGTTGLPKPIVHGHGGILLEHLKLGAFHHGLGPGERLFYFSTTGWMIWNLLASALAVGSGVVLYDGDPSRPDLSTLWRLAAETRTTSFGGSAGFYMACRKSGIVPKELVDTSALRTVLSTGAPLPPEGFRWIYEAVSDDVFLASTSGGTDVCTAFVGGSPLLPVRAGEIACCCLGCKVEAFDASGKPVIGAQGELVVTEPMPSMPVGFWNDPDGSRYRATYFEDFPGVWRHGDWIKFSPSGAAEISGRSDATLNRGGVRLGTSEFYSVVENMPEVTDSLVVHLEDPEGGSGELILFVVLAPGATWDDTLRTKVARELRGALSPRHVPDTMHAVAAVPRTLSGKKLEVPVKRILTGLPADTAANRGAMANPESLEAFEKLVAERRAEVRA